MDYNSEIGRLARGYSVSPPCHLTIAVKSLTWGVPRHFMEQGKIRQRNHGISEPLLAKALLYRDLDT